MEETNTTCSLNKQGQFDCKTFKFYMDAGHGWLAVPVKLLKELQIDKKITTYSYMSHGGNMAYLEEDSDGTLFTNEYQKKFGKKPDYKAIDQGTSSPIRNYPSYKFGWRGL